MNTFHYGDDYEMPEEVMTCHYCAEFDDCDEGISVSMSRWDDCVDYHYCPKAGTYVCNVTSATGCDGFMLDEYGRDYLEELKDISETYKSLRNVR